MGQSRVGESPRAMTRNTVRAPMPIPQNGTVPPQQVPHPERPPREYLTPKEVERLITAARQNRHGHRDAAMIRVAYRHGLRVSDAVRAPLGSGRLRARALAHAPDQERYGQRPPARGR